MSDRSNYADCTPEELLSFAHNKACANMKPDEVYREFVREGIELKQAGDIVKQVGDERAATAAKQQARQSARTKPKPRGKVIVRRYSDITPKVATWTWANRIPRATLGLLTGTEGLGKTAAALDLVAKLTHGKLPGIFYGRPAACALFTPEDDPERTLGPRLIAAGADHARVLDFKVCKDKYDIGVSLPEDTEQIAKALVANDVRFMFTDPLAALLNPKVNSWSESEIRAALEPMIAVCAKHDITWLGSLHTNKGNSNDVRQRNMGTAGWRILARSAFLLGLDPDDEKGKDGVKRCLYHDKHNYGTKQPTLRIDLAEAKVTIEGREQGTVRAITGEECWITDREMLAAEAESPEAGKRKLDRARKWLGVQLAGGGVAVEKLKELAELNKLAWRTVERAKAELEAETSLPRGGKGGAIWSLAPSGGLNI